MAMKRLLTLLAAVLLLGITPGSSLAAHAAPAASAPATRSVMVFVTADDKGAENSTSKMASIIEDAVGHNSSYELVDLRDAAGDAVSGDVRSAKKMADDDLAAAKKSFASGSYEDAESKLHSAIKEYENAAPALEKPDPYVEAIAYLAGTLQLRNKEDDARDELITALGMKPAFKPDAKLGSNAFMDLLRSAKKEMNEGHKGTASVNTVPAGGKVIVDGESKGYAPVSIDRLPVGKHVFIFERGGYQNGGQVAEVSSTEDTIIKGKFVPTQNFADVEDSLSQAAKEVQSSSAGPNTWKLLSHFKLDRAIVAVVRTSGDNLVLDLALVDAKAKRRISKRRNSFEGEEYGTLNREVNKLVSGLLADAEDPEKNGTVKPKNNGKDPLDSVSGMEDWDDDNGSSSKKGQDDSDRPKKKSHDDDN